MSFTSSLTNLRVLTDYVTSKNFYVHLVRAVPARSVTTVASLSIPTGGNYTSKDVTLGTPVADGTGARVNLSSGTSIFWDDLTANASMSVVGMALCRRLGASPATSDEFVSFLPYTTPTTVTNCTTTSGSPIITTTDTFASFVNDQAISGTGIPVGSRILSIPSSTQLVLNQRATAAGTGSIQVSVPATYEIKTSTGDTVEFVIATTGLIKFD